jgi:hypothetical protein
MAKYYCLVRFFLPSEGGRKELPPRGRYEAALQLQTRVKVQTWVFKIPAGLRPGKYCMLKCEPIHEDTEVEPPVEFEVFELKRRIAEGHILGTESHYSLDDG